MALPRWWRAKKKSRQSELRLWPAPIRTGWRKKRLAIEDGPCEIDSEHGPGATRDHIVPRRLAQAWPGPDPDNSKNLMRLCESCHGKKLKAERKLYRGDKLGFLRILRCAGWPMERVEAALELYRQ